MTAYALYIIDLGKVTTPEEREAATRKIPNEYHSKLKDIEAHHGVTLRRERCGFSGIKGNTEYVAIKISI